MPHKRTDRGRAHQRELKEEHNEWKEASRFVSLNSYDDPWDEHGEEVNRVTPGQIYAHLQQFIRLPDLDVVNSFDQGEVLSGGLSERNSGTLQRMVG